MFYIIMQYNAICTKSLKGNGLLYEHNFYMYLNRIGLVLKVIIRQINVSLSTI